MRHLPIHRRAFGFVFDVAELYFTKRVSRSAAELAYFLVLSFFPVLICINAIIGTLDLDLTSLPAETQVLIPEAVLSVLTDYVGYITTNQSRTLLWVGAVTTLFSGSAAMRSLMNAMDDIFEGKSYTGLWQVVASVAFSALFLLTMYLSLIVVLTGSWFFHLLEKFIRHFPFLAHVTLPWEWQWMRFLILFCFVMIVVMVLYRAGTHRKRPRPPVLPGAFTAAAALVVTSAVFSYFIGLSTRYSMIYGPLVSVIVLLVWLYLCGTVIILGNCVNRVWYDRREEKGKKRRGGSAAPDARPEQS